MKYDLLKPWTTLDQWQKDYIEEEGDCFLLCGRQSGKTAAASIKFGKKAATKANQIIMMIAFTEKQAYNLFFKTLMYLKAVYPKQLITKGRYKPTKHEINLKNGSRIMCYAAGLTGEGLRTFTLTHLVVDEAAPMAKEIFVATMPMLSVTNGKMDVLSTPRGKEGFFFECSTDPLFRKFYVNAEDCPRHSKKFLKEQRARMSPLEYAQEYQAKFLDELRRVFSDKAIIQSCILKRRTEMIHHRDYSLGVDVARRDKDKFTKEVLDITNRDNIVQVENIVTKNTPIPQSVREIIALNEKYNFMKEYIDSGGMGITVCDLLREDDNNKRKVVEINNAARRYQEEGEDRKKGILKEDLYENLVMLMETGRIKLLDDNDLITSLKSIQFEIKNKKAIYYGADTHITEGLIRAAWGIKDKGLNIYIY